ncbi:MULTISPECIES: hypothetical protein [unclassified Bradyrhizobium]|uniref:hypothetical protein n=1 Tax=unclassified Bradyrhizobium TaxID=2631580 RepID=UPI0028EA1FAC|nr:MULTISPECIES: hypothetical protein [unclassified Bradyrhizobium]
MQNMTTIEAANLIRCHYGQRPNGEAPPRKMHLIARAYEVLGPFIVDYLYALACGDRPIPRPQPGQDDGAYKRFLHELMLSDEGGWRGGVETPGAELAVVTDASWLFCISAAGERGLPEPTSVASIEVPPQKAIRGSRLHIFDRRTKCPVYNAVVGMGADARAVRVRRKSGEISHRTIYLSGWGLGAGWVGLFPGHDAEQGGPPDLGLRPGHPIR